MYSFGVTAYELLTSRLPFEDLDPDAVLEAHATRPAPLVSSLRPGLRTFDRVIARMLAKDPRARYAGFATAIGALDAAIARWRSGSLEPAPSYPEGGGPGRGELLRILVIDDDDHFRKVAARAAQLAFYRRSVSVTVAKSGVEALAKAERAVPDLVILDLHIGQHVGAHPGGLDGVETISRLRAMPKGAETRVLVVSDAPSDAERWRFSILGVNDFFGKQAQLVELVHAIGQIGERGGWLGGEEEAPPTSTYG